MILHLLGRILEMVDVPTTADFEALDARVTALEDGTAPPSPDDGQPSQDGDKTSEAGEILITNEGCAWRITAARAIEYYSPGETEADFAPAGRTAAVTEIMKWSDGLYQTSPNNSGLSQPGWWRAVMQGVEFASWVAVPGDPSKPVPTTGTFKCANGSITGPNGKPWRAQGVNVCYRRLWGDYQPDIGRVTADRLLHSLPTMNMVRFADLYSYPYSDAAHPDNKQACDWIQSLTDRGVVVEMEVHHMQQVATGAQLDEDCRWLSEWATKWKNNPRVHFGTQNEPHGGGAQISAMMKRMYDAVRSTGNTNPVYLACGNPGGEMTDMNPADFASMDNTAFDAHYYGWIPNNGMSWKTITDQLAKYSNRQGKIAVCCLETGDATDGNNIDGNWQQVLRDALGSQNGGAAWMINWTGGEGYGDCLWASPFDGSHITSYGQFCLNLWTAPSTMSVERTRYLPEGWQDIALPEGWQGYGPA